MVEPIKHNTTSSMSTAGWETAKGAGGGTLLGGLLGTIGGALVGAVSVLPAALVVGLVGAAVGFLAPVSVGVATGAVVGAGAVAGFGAIVGAAGGLLTGGVVGAGAGGLFGLAKGGDKITRENHKVDQRIAQRQNSRQEQLVNANAAGIQDGYQMGFEEGKNYVVNQLRAAQEQMLMAQAAQQQAAKGGHADKIMKQREAQAAATQQIG